MWPSFEHQSLHGPPAVDHQSRPAGSADVSRPLNGRSSSPGLAAAARRRRRTSGLVYLEPSSSSSSSSSSADADGVNRERTRTVFGSAERSYASGSANAGDSSTTSASAAAAGAAGVGFVGAAVGDADGLATAVAPTGFLQSAGDMVGGGSGRSSADVQTASALLKGSTCHDECVVCGDRASGFHYNAFSCEGCKGFFRRSILRNAVYSCKYGGNCEMDIWMRRRCQACRLRRCLEVGMRQECLLSESQCKARESRRKIKNVRGRVSSVSTDTDSMMTESAGDLLVSPLERITLSDRELIESLVQYQEVYELPKEADIASLSDFKVDEAAMPKDVPSAVFQHMVNMTILTTQLVVEFSKKLPGFLSLDKDDQILLLKGSGSEVMMLRTARRYDPEEDKIIFGDNTAVTRENLCLGGLLQDYVDDMFEFARNMSILAVDNAEYALLTAICIFSDRPDLTNVRQVDVCRERFVDALVAYEQHRRPHSSNFLAKLLLKLVDLRTLSHSHATALRVLRVERGQLPPLLSEYFDIFD